MARKLGELLVENGLITEEQLERALQAQVCFGGRIGTNLVELGMLTTTRLAEFLSRQLTVECLVPSQLEAIPEEALAAVPAELADRYEILPLSLEKRTLKVAMADPTDLDAVDAVSFQTGLRVVPVVAPELLVLYALEKLYGVTRPNRYIRVTEALTQSEYEPAPGFGDDDTQADVIEAPPAEEMESYGLAEAAADLIAAERHSQVLEILRRTLRESFARVVVLAVDERRARIWGQSGCALPPDLPPSGARDPVHGIEIPIEQSSLFQDIARRHAAVFGRPPQSDADSLLLRLIGLEEGEPALAVPLRRAAGSMVAAALAAGPFEPEPRTDDFTRLAAKASDALELVRLKKRILTP